MADSETLHLLVDAHDPEAHVLDHVEVQRVGVREYEILRSPCFVRLIAAGDVIRLDEADPHRFTVVRRGGNVSVHVSCGTPIAPEVRDALARALADIGGRLDEESLRVLVFTIPASVGFSRIDALLNALVERCPGARWGYGNACDPADGVTPLERWDEAGSGADALQAAPAR